MKSDSGWHASDPSRDLPWPSQNDDIRQLGADWWTHALITPGDNGARMFGLREGADLLARAMLDDRARLDTLLYPFGLCWCFYLELRLKSLLGRLRAFVDEPAHDDGTHDLRLLW